MKAVQFLMVMMTALHIQSSSLLVVFQFHRWILVVNCLKLTILSASSLKLTKMRHDLLKWLPKIGRVCNKVTAIVAWVRKWSTPFTLGIVFNFVKLIGINMSYVRLNDELQQIGNRRKNVHQLYLSNAQWAGMSSPWESYTRNDSGRCIQQVSVIEVESSSLVTLVIGKNCCLQNSYTKQGETKGLGTWSAFVTSTRSLCLSVLILPEKPFASHKPCFNPETTTIDEQLHFVSSTATPRLSLSEILLNQVQLPS